MGKIELIKGDCLKVLKTLPDKSFDNILRVFSDVQEIRKKYIDKFNYYNKKNNILCYQTITTKNIISLSEILKIKLHKKRTESKEI